MNDNFSEQDLLKWHNRVDVGVSTDVDTRTDEDLIHDIWNTLL
jgi:hypothetical protein